MSEGISCLKSFNIDFTVFIEVNCSKNGVAQSLCMWEVVGAFDPLWHDRKKTWEKELWSTTAN